MGHSIQQEENTYTSRLHMEHFSWENHILGYKISLNTFKMIETIQSMFCDNNKIKLDINYRNQLLNSQIRGN